MRSAFIKVQKENTIDSGANVPKEEYYRTADWRTRVSFYDTGGMFTMLNIAICDDENYILDDLNLRINLYLNDTKKDAHISCFESGISLLGCKKIFDVIIMDIKMAGINGMETVRSLRMKGINSQVIFVTSIKDYVFQAFDVDAIHYLMKPVSNQDLFHALDKAIQHTGQVDKQVITIIKGGTVQVIPFRDIYYIEAIDHKIYICTAAGKIDYHYNLDELEKQLDERFFRCHRSYIVNMNFVACKKENLAIMVNDDRILVSRRKAQPFLQQLLLFIRKEVL